VERKIATVLFVDLVDSTALFAAADPEVVRRRVTLYFDRARECIEAHGGTVEKFAGDAVMAAFGVPRAHEDDAERAVKSAFAVMEAVHELGLEVRAGIEAGEVVVDEVDSTFATGEAVNVAARLQQAAGAGEIVLGPGVRRLTAGTVEVEDLGPLDVKGRAEPVWSWRATAVVDGRRRVGATRFVGREDELELLENTFARVVRERRAHLVTVYGEPGVGKSRLVREFLEGVERATLLTGRALPYGEGVAYWPLASMIKASAGIDDDDPANEAFEKLRLCCESEAVADLLAVALGVLGAAESDRTGDEIAWAAVNWARQLADAQPLVLVFEDMHWADDRLLDLVEHLARTLRDAPTLLVAVARHELAEEHPAWGGGNPRAAALDLAPLADEESVELATLLLRDHGLPPAQCALLLEKAEGNPLFLEETARMIVDSEGSPPDRIPDTVQALIAARIDRLPADEKRLLQRAAVTGRVFWRGALDRLSSDLDVASLLDNLLERDLVLPEERSSISGDRAFKFRHVLIREVAYATTTKAQRYDDHRAFAGWLQEHAPDELVEIRAYHLDQAACIARELDGETPPELAVEAAQALEDSGRRALRRGAFRAARRLLARSAELEPTLERRYLSAHAAWRQSDVGSVRDETRSVLDDARAAGERGIEGRALVLLAEIALQADSDVTSAHNLADDALAALPVDELHGLYDAHALLANIAWWIGDADLSHRHCEAMIELAHETDRPDLESLALTQLAGVASVQDDLAGAGKLLVRARALADESGSREALGWALAVSAASAQAEGDLARAEAELEEARTIFDEIGAAGRFAWATTRLGSVKESRGDLIDAETLLRDAVRRLRATHEHGFLVEAQRQLAEVLLKRGRIAEAERLALSARDEVGRDDVWTRASVCHALGLVRAAQGRIEEAERLLEEGLAVLQPTMYKRFADEVREDLAELREDITAPAVRP
jgi:class 3 adenylate cyclase/tetratricopeptide (TPR) repeat protein